MFSLRVSTLVLASNLFFFFDLSLIFTHIHAATKQSGNDLIMNLTSLDTAMVVSR